MRIFVTIFTFLLLASAAQAKDIQLFNPDILGQPTSTAVKLLIDKKADEVEPYMVTTDIKCSKYSAASIFYRGKLSFDDIRTTINKSFQNYENLSLLKPPVQAIWRVKDRRFSISLREEAEGIFRVTYIKFISNTEAFKAIMKVEGIDVDAIDEDDCKETENKGK
jgi:hypothetical protein